MYIKFILTKGNRRVLKIISEILYLYLFMSIIYSFVFYLKTTNSETLVRCSSLLVGVLSCYCCVGIIAEEEAYESELFQKAKVGEFILTKIWVNLSEMYPCENWCICLEKHKFLCNLTLPLSFMQSEKKW